MNDLTTTPNSPPAKITSPDLSQELTALLDDAGSPDNATRKIAADPALLAEATAALPVLHHVATAKAGASGVKAVIGRRLATFPQPARSDGEWDAWWADYYEALADVPLSSLEAGMRAYIALPDSEFMPKPGKLRELAERSPSRSLGRFYRAKRAIQFAEEALPAPEIERVDPAAVKEMLTEFQAKSVGAVKKPELPSISGVVDERGVTPQMRALIARRAAA